MSLLPDDPENTILKRFKKAKARTTKPLPRRRRRPGVRTRPPTATSSSTGAIDGGYAKAERDRLRQLIEGGNGNVLTLSDTARRDDAKLRTRQVDSLDLDARHAARGMRRVRHFRPSRRRRHHRARAARPAASRPGSRRHRLLRRQPLSFRTPARPGRRHLLPPRRDRPPARHLGRRPCPLFHHRRHHPAQRAAAVRRTECRRLRGRPQRQSHQRPDAAPRTGAQRRDDAVDHRHRGDPASGRAVASAAASSTASSRRCARSRAPIRWCR